HQQAQILYVAQDQVDVLAFGNGFWNRISGDDVQNELALLPQLARQKATEAGLPAEAERALEQQLNERVHAPQPLRLIFTSRLKKDSGMRDRQTSEQLLFNWSPFTRQTSNLRLKQCRAVENKIFARCPLRPAWDTAHNFVYTIRCFQRTSFLGLVAGAAGKAYCPDRQDRRAIPASGSAPWSPCHERLRERISHRSHCDTGASRFKFQEDLTAQPRTRPSQPFDSAIARGSAPEQSNRTSNNPARLGDTTQVASRESQCRQLGRTC